MDPITEESNVLLALKLTKFLMSDDGVDYVVLSRYNNAINELQNGKVVSTYRFSCPFAVVQQLKVFFSYEPKFKHYIFLNGSNLMIIRKTRETMSLHKTYCNVSTYRIEDHLNLGKPQVVIYPLEDDPVILTDCNNEKLSFSEKKVVPALASLINKSNLSIKSAQALLSQKRQLLSKLSVSLAFNSSDDCIASTAGRLVLLREGIVKGTVGMPAKKEALTVGTPWLRKNLGSWVVGFPITNVSTKDIVDFQMFISHDYLTVKQTALYRKNTRAKAAECYRKESKLPPEQSGVIVSVMDEPCLSESSFLLQCVCCFSTTISEYVDQCYLGSLDIITTELATEKYQVANPLSAVDLIAIQASSRENELAFDPITISLDDFFSKLSSWHGFEEIHHNIFVSYSSRKMFAPTSLMVFRNSINVITFYTATYNEFLSIVHNLIGTFRGAILFKHPKSDPRFAMNAIIREIGFIKELLIQKLCEPDMAMLPSSTDDIIRDLMLHEISSAVEMNAVKEYAM